MIFPENWKQIGSICGKVAGSVSQISDSEPEDHLAKGAPLLNSLSSIFYCDADFCDEKIMKTIYLTQFIGASM